MLQSITLHSNLLPFVCVSTYNGLFSYDVLFERIEDEKPEFIELDYVDWKSIGKMIGQSYMQVLHQHMLSEIGYIKDYDHEKIKFHMPEAYNFADDSFSVPLQINVPKLIDRVRELINTEREICEDFIDRHWKTRDGFWSFMPESVEGVLEISNPDSDKLDEVLAFALNVEFIVEYSDSTDTYYWSEEAFEELSGNNCIDDYAHYRINWNANEPILAEYKRVGYDVAKEFAISNGFCTEEGLSSALGHTYGADIVKSIGSSQSKELMNEFDYLEFPIYDSEEALLILVLYMHKVDKILRQ